MSVKRNTYDTTLNEYELYTNKRSDKSSSWQISKRKNHYTNKSNIIVLLQEYFIQIDTGERKIKDKILHNKEGIHRLS